MTRANRPVDPTSVPAVASRMTEGELQLLLCYLTRDLSTLGTARTQFASSLLSPAAESGASLYLDALYAYYDRYGSLPVQPHMTAEFARVAAESPLGGREADVRWAENVLTQAFDPVMTEAVVQNRRFGLDLLVRLLTERTVVNRLEAVIRQTPGQYVLSDVGAVFTHLSGQLGQVNSLRAADTVPLFPDDAFTLEMPTVIQTGVDFLDDTVLGGGCHAGKVYGLLGPYGSFKTGLGVQIAVSSSERQVGRPDEGLSVYFVYEGGASEIRIRGIAQAADMPKDTVEEYFRQGQNPTVLSTASSLKQYEIDRYQIQEQQLPGRPGELERLADARHRMANLRIADMSGPRENPDAGSGYAQEIVSYLERLTYSTRLPIKMVVIDYVKKLCVRHLQAKGWSFDRLRELASPFPDLIRRTVAEKFGCAVWLLQQLNAEANKKAPGSAQHHADAAESRDFGENLWYAITLSNPDRRNNHTLNLAVTKSRDTAAPPSGMVVRIDATRFELVRDPDFVVGGDGRIQSRLHHQFIHGQVEAPTPSQSQSRPGAPNPADADPD